MPTILEIARHADVSAENVLRVVNGEAVSGDVSARVERAIDELGPPVLGHTALAPRTRPVVETPVAEGDDMMAALAAQLPRDVGSVVYEAVRVEVRPVTQHLAQLEQLFDQVVRRLEELSETERRERLEDLALVIELITTGWRGVDRRLGRVERILARLDAERNGDAHVRPRGRGVNGHDDGNA